jgi:hypothetical protein
VESRDCGPGPVEESQPLEQFGGQDRPGRTVTVGEAKQSTPFVEKRGFGAVVAGSMPPPPRGGGGARGGRRAKCHRGNAVL